MTISISSGSTTYPALIPLANVCRERARARCRSGDGGRPSEVGLQEQASNSRKLRWSRAIVVNVTEKGVTNTSCKDQGDERE
jgi:hypothetical protein